MISNHTTLYLSRQKFPTHISMPIPRQTNDRSRTQTNRMLIWLMEGSLWSVWRSASVSLGSHWENRFPTSPSMHIRRSDIEWRRLWWLIGNHVIIVKKVWEFTAQPSAQRTFERLWRAFVVKPWSKNDNNAHVSWVEFTFVSIDKFKTIANVSETCWNIYRSLQSSCTNHGCRQFWMPLVVNVASSGCLQMRMPQAVAAANSGCCQL